LSQKLGDLRTKLGRKLGPILISDLGGIEATDNERCWLNGRDAKRGERNLLVSITVWWNKVAVRTGWTRLRSLTVNTVAPYPLSGRRGGDRSSENEEARVESAPKGRDSTRGPGERLKLL